MMAGRSGGLAFTTLPKLSCGAGSTIFGTGCGGGCGGVATTAGCSTGGGGTYSGMRRPRLVVIRLAPFFWPARHQEPDQDQQAHHDTSPRSPAFRKR